MNEKISVIVPIYKVEPYLRKCLDSICTQTYENLEIILVDDGSPDGCGAICDEYAAKDGRIKVIHKPNGGLSDARNAGLKIMTGAYVTFVDSDDWIEPEHIQSLFSTLDSTGADIAVSDVRRVISNNECVGTFSYQNLQDITHEDIFGYVWNKLYKRERIRNTQFPRIFYIEDLPFNLEIYQTKPRYAFTGKASYCYLQREGSILTNPVSSKKIDDFLAFSAVIWTQLVRLYGAGDQARYEYTHIVGNLTCNFFCDISREKSLSVRDKHALLHRILNGVSPEKFAWRYADHTLLRLLVLSKTIRCPMVFVWCYKLIYLIKGMLR